MLVTGKVDFYFLMAIFERRECVYLLELNFCSAKLLQSCPTLCDPMDCSPPGSSVHGILQARVLEWAAMPSSRGSSKPGIEP